MMITEEAISATCLELGDKLCRLPPTRAAISVQPIPCPYSVLSSFKKPSHKTEWYAMFLEVGEDYLKLS